MNASTSGVTMASPPRRPLLSTLRTLALGGFLAIALGSSAQAQFGGVLHSPERDSTVARVLSRFSHGEAIRFALLRSRWAGSYMGHRGDTLFLGARGEPPMVVLFNAVDTLWQTTSGRRFGAGIGAITGAAVGALLAGAVPGSVGLEGRSAGVRAGAVVGATVAGAAVGAIAGSFSRRWRRVYP